MNGNTIDFVVTEDIIRDVEEMVARDSSIEDKNYSTTTDDYLMTVPIFFRKKDIPSNLFTEDILNLNNIDFDNQNVKGILKTKNDEYLLFEPSDGSINLKKIKYRDSKKSSSSKSKRYSLSKFLKDLEKKNIPTFKEYSERPGFAVSSSKLNDMKLRHNNSLIGIMHAKNSEPYYLYDKRDSIPRTRTPRGAKLFKSELDIPKNLKSSSYLRKIGMMHNGIVYGVLRKKSGVIGEDLYDINKATVVDVEKYEAYKKGEVYNLYLINGNRVKTNKLSWNGHLNNCINEHDDYVIIDTETTGKELTDQVIQLSIINLKGEVLFNSYFYTDKNMSGNAYNVNKISQETINSSPKWTEKWDEIKSILKDKIIIAHYAKFDVERIISTCKRNKLDIDFELNYLCTMEHPNSEGHKSKRLVDILSGMGMKFNKNSLHEALFDCQGCLYIINQYNDIFKLREKAESYYQAICDYDTGEDKDTRRKKGINWLLTNFNIKESEFAVLEKSTAKSIISKLEPFIKKRNLLND